MGAKLWAGRLWALILAVVLVSGLQEVSGWARERVFKVDGKEVSRSAYDAALAFNESIELLRENYTERAIGKLRRALLLNPDMPEAHTNLGVLLARIGRLDEARSHFLKAVSASKAVPEAYLMLATLYQTTGEVDRSIETYQQYLRRFGDDPALAKVAQGAIDLLTEEQERRRRSASQTRTDYYAGGTADGVMRWSATRMPLRVYIRPADGVAGYQSSYDTILRQSFYDWSQASGRRVRFVFVAKSNDADITCNWTNDPSLLKGGAEAGETRGKTLGHAIVEAKIFLRSKEEAGAIPYSENSVRLTCLHEIGHALGISGHSPDPGDVMFFSTSLTDAARNLSMRDRNTIQMIYSRDLDIGSTILDFLVNWRMLSVWAGMALAAALLVSPLWLLRRGKSGKRKKR